MILVTLLFALFASVFVIAKEALQHCSPFFLVGSRMLLASLILFGYLWIVQRPIKFWPKPYLLKKLFLLGVFNIYLTNVFEFWGLQYLSPAKTCFIYSLSPFISAVLSYFVLSEKLSPKKWLGLGIGCIGFIPILMGQGSDEVLSGHLLFLSWAEISVLAAACSTVYGWIIMRELVSDEGFCPITANAWSMLFGGLLATGNSFFTETWDPFPVSSLWPYAKATLLMIVISSLICYNLYGFLLKKYTATFLAFAGFTTPIFTALFQWLWLDKTVSIAFMLSSAIVLVGLSLFYQEELKKNGIHTDEPAPQT